MKKMLMAVLILRSVQALAETWTNVPLLDSSCAARVKNNPDAHNPHLRTAMCSIGLWHPDQ